MKLRSGVWTTETSGSLGKRCWRREGKGGSSPKQPKQHGTRTLNRTGTRAATRNSPPSGTSGASTFAGPTGTTNSRGPRHLRQHRPRPRPRSPERCNQCGHQAPTSSLQSDDDDSELTKLLAFRARRRATQARYRARHPERVAEQKRRYRAKYPDRVVEQRRRYAAQNRDQLVEERRRYHQRYDARRREAVRKNYAAHAERLREHKRQFYRSEAGQRWQKQYLARKRESAALLRQQRGPATQKRTLDKIQALGPLKLTVTLEDFMTDFCNTLSPTPEDSLDQPGTLMDMDSGVFHPLDHSVCDESSLSSCDMWDDEKGFVANLLDDLPSSSDDSLLDNLLEELDDLSSSDDCFFDFLNDMMQEEDPSFDLDDFVS